MKMLTTTMMKTSPVARLFRKSSLACLAGLLRSYLTVGERDRGSEKPGPDGSVQGALSEEDRALGHSQGFIPHWKNAKGTDVPPFYICHFPCEEKKPSAETSLWMPSQAWFHFKGKSTELLLRLTLQTPTPIYLGLCYCTHCTGSDCEVPEHPSLV